MKKSRSRTWKKTVCITIEPKQHRDLKKLAKYTGKNVSGVVRELLPTKEEIEAFQAYQDFIDIDKPHRKEVLDKITRTRRLFFETVMSGHIQAPIGLQVAAVSYFDKTGIEIAKLFKNWINALRSKEGCRFESMRFKRPGKPEYIYYMCLARRESKQDVESLIAKYSASAPDAEVISMIKKTARVKGKKSKTQRKATGKSPRRRK